MLTKDEYIAKKKLQLDEWSANIAILEAKALQSKEKHVEKLVSLHAYQLEGMKQLELLKTSSEGTWKKLKGESENVWVALKDSLRQFQTHFK